MTLCPLYVTLLRSPVGRRKGALLGYVWAKLGFIFHLEANPFEPANLPTDLLPEGERDEAKSAAALVITPHADAPNHASGLALLFRAFMDVVLPYF